jgi:hypothetical protein
MSREDFVWVKMSREDFIGPNWTREDFIGQKGVGLSDCTAGGEYRID